MKPTQLGKWSKIFYSLCHLLVRRCMFRWSRSCFGSYLQRFKQHASYGFGSCSDLSILRSWLRWIIWFIHSYDAWRRDECEPPKTILEELPPLGSPNIRFHRLEKQMQFNLPRLELCLYEGHVTTLWKAKELIGYRNRTPSQIIWLAFVGWIWNRSNWTCITEWRVRL